jgi:trans-2,3-dihydro-3-hydroxyanthranilate isomerase
MNGPEQLPTCGARMRPYRLVHVDVFTRVPFGGNQLAVFPEAEGLSDDEMLTIAREMNFSESVFVVPPRDAAADARLRIFTPARELPFAGHPTVGAAFVLARERGVRAITLELGVGPLRVEADPGDGRLGAATMEQPIPRFEPAPAEPAALAGMVGLGVVDLAEETPPEIGSAGVPFLYLRARSLDAIRRARGDADAMARVFGERDHPAVYLFATETVEPEAASHARMLSLLLGAEVREDPATGGASGPAGAYLVRHGLASPGRLLLEQGYEMGRPSQIVVEIEASGERVTRVRVGGGVALVAEGTLYA